MLGNMVLSKMNLESIKSQKNNMLLITILFISLVIVVLIWNTESLKSEKTVKTDATYSYESGLVKDNIVYQQLFSPCNSELKKIAIQISKMEAGEGGKLGFSIFDNNNNCIFNSENLLSEIPDKQYYEIDVNLKLSTNEQYYYQISAKECSGKGIRVRFGDIKNINLTEQSGINYSNEFFSQYSSFAKYIYLEEPDYIIKAMYCSWIVTLGLICYTIMKLFSKHEV